METINISFIDSSEQIPFVLTYGIHRELQDYLMTDNRLFQLYNNVEVSDEVIKLCLSKRNEMGLIINEFLEIQLIQAADILKLLDFVFEYFSDFFLKSNQKVQTVSNKLNQISQQSQVS